MRLGEDQLRQADLTGVATDIARVQLPAVCLVRVGGAGSRSEGMHYYRLLFFQREGREKKTKLFGKELNWLGVMKTQVTTSMPESQKDR